LVTPLVVLVLLAMAVAMSERRWRALGIVGTVVAGVSLLFLGLMALAKQVVGRSLDPFVARDAFDAAWDVIARSLANSTLIIVIGALVVAVGGFVIDQILTRRPTY
jgi:multisubunit Na+/H+ antiporter MnhB subunit